MFFLTRSVSEDQLTNDASRFLADASGYDVLKCAISKLMLRVEISGRP
jgi:hypothetical protein